MSFFHLSFSQVPSGSSAQSMRQRGDLARHISALLFLKASFLDSSDHQRAGDSKLPLRKGHGPSNHLYPVSPAGLFFAPLNAWLSCGQACTGHHLNEKNSYFFHAALIKQVYPDTRKER